jgi:hypothetical protein
MRYSGAEMSYVRWSAPGKPWDYESDLYIYDDINGGITCLSDEFNCETHDEMIEHVKEHIEKGDAVPDFVIPRLQERKNVN